MMDLICMCTHSYPTVGQADNPNAKQASSGFNEALWRSLTYLSCLSRQVSHDHWQYAQCTVNISAINLKCSLLFLKLLITMILKHGWGVSPQPANRVLAEFGFVRVMCSSSPSPKTMLWIPRPYPAQWGGRCTGPSSVFSPLLAGSGP